MRPLSGLPRLALCLLAAALAACESRPDHLAPEDDLADTEWSLVDQDSSAVAFPSDFAGRPTVVSAIYTQCPDVCLMTMATLRRVRAALGPDTSRVRFVTLSFDPARDTPSVLRRYAASWNTGPGWHLLTGDSTEVASLMDRIGVRTRVLRRDTLASGTVGYAIDHSDVALLLDADGAVVETYGGSAAIPEMVAEDARALL